MFKKIAGLFRKEPALVTGTGKLKEGHAKIISFGDVLAGTGVQVMLTRKGGELTAIDAVCPHQGALMDDGELIDGEFVVCPLHMYHFDPESGRERSDLCRDAQSYKIRQAGDDAEIWI